MPVDYENQGDLCRTDSMLTLQCEHQQAEEEANFV
jgi:hypothetical protein